MLKKLKSVKCLNNELPLADASLLKWFIYFHIYFLSFHRKNDRLTQAGPRKYSYIYSVYPPCKTHIYKLLALFAMTLEWKILYTAKFNCIYYRSQSIFLYISLMIIKQRECFCPTKYKISFSDWKWKIWVLFKHIFDQIMFLKVLHFTSNLVSKN